MVNNLVFRWPKPLFFMVLGAHGIFWVSTPLPTSSTMNFLQGSTTAAAATEGTSLNLEGFRLNKTPWNFAKVFC